MKNLRYLLALGFSLLILSACSDSSTNEGPSSTDKAMSLKSGNLWNYNVTRYKEDGSTEGVKAKYSLQILKDTVIKDQTTYMFKSGEEIGGFVDKSEGLYRWEKTAEDTLRLMLICKYPIVKGESYALDNNVIATIEEVNKSIAVPAGKFKCFAVKLTFGAGNYYEYDYYAKNVGLIKSECWCTGSTGAFYMYQEEELASKNF